MTEPQYHELVEFLAGKFDRVSEEFRRFDARLDAVEQRLSAADVSLESLRDDVRQVAEGVMATNERLDRFEASVNARFDRLELRFDGLERGLHRVENRVDETFANLSQRVRIVEERQ
jgi:predicted  nucleic acid-binding Zn-ribbon protein